MVLSDVHLKIVGEVILHHQHILDIQFFLNTYGDFHLDIINVDQVHGFCAEDRLQARLLHLCFKLDAMNTVAYTMNGLLHHFWPPKPLLNQTESAVSALVSGVSMATVNGGTPFVGGYDKGQHSLITVTGSGLEVQ